MAKYKDHKDREWEVKFTVPRFLQLCRKLNLKLNQLINLDLQVADVVEALPILLEGQLKDRGLTAAQFLEEMTGEDLAQSFKAYMEAVGDAFPSIKSKGGEANPTGPFVPGK